MVHPKCFFLIAKKQKASSAESPSCHQSKEREREYWAGLTVPLSGEASAPTKKCNRVVGAVYCFSPARGNQPPKKGISCDRRKRDSVWEMIHPKYFFPTAKKMFLKPNLLCAKQGGVCVCVCVGNGPSKIFFSNALTPWSIDYPNVWTYSIKYLNMVHKSSKLHLSKSDKSILV